MNLLKNFSWKIAASLAGGGTFFLFTVLVIHALGPAEYGKFAFAMSWAGLFGILVDFGFNPVITRDVSRHPEQGLSYFTRIARLKVILASVSGTVLMALSLLHPNGRELLPMILYAFLYFAACSYVEMGQAFSYAYEKFRQGATLSMTHKWLIALCGTGIVWLGYGTSPILKAMGLAACGGAAVTFLYFRWFFHTLPVEPMAAASERSLFMESLPLFLQNAFIVVYFRIDTVMMSWMKGNQATGLYNAAYRFFEVSNVIPTAFMAAAIAMLSRQVETHVWARTFWRYLAYSLGLALGGVLVLQGIARYLPYSVLGSDFEGSRHLLRILSFTLLFLFPNYLLTTLLTLVKRQDANAWIAAVCVVFNIGINLLAIPRWGAEGAAWTTLGTEALVSLLCMGFLFKTQPQLHSFSL